MIHAYVICDLITCKRVTHEQWHIEMLNSGTTMMRTLEENIGTLDESNGRFLKYV